MAKKFLCALLSVFLPLVGYAVTRHWTAADGLPTGEVQQIVELPNGQLLVNCEGVFCLSDGKSFTPLPCERNATFLLGHYVQGYAYLWQGDSLLWLRDFYRVYLFDARTRSFRYDICPRLQDAVLARFAKGECGHEGWTEPLRRFAQEQELGGQATCATVDRQRGVWIGTRTGGIHYFAPARHVARVVRNDPAWLERVTRTIDSQGRLWECRRDGLLCTSDGRQTLYHSGNVRGMTHVHMNFVTELPDRRLLICYTLHELGYFDPENHVFTSLNARLPALSRFRYMVGACPINERWTAVYTQNGAFLLDVKEDSLAAFPQTEAIENFSDKYNCMLRDGQGCLWVGTQNGLFRLAPTALHGQGKPDYTCERISGLATSCIRSLVADASGNIWAGTSCGLSRITPSVVNLGADDGVPSVSMRERAACRTDDGYLAFAHEAEVVVLHPDSILPAGDPGTVVLTSLFVNNERVRLAQLASDEVHLPYNRNYLTFQCSALNYATPSHTHYRYRLRELEPDWHLYEGSGDGLCTVDYRALVPGTYTFEAQVAVGDGPWGATLRKVVVVHPPLWLTEWAKLSYALILIGVMLLALRSYWRHRQAKLEKENDARVNRLFELREEARHQFAEATSIDPQQISVGCEEEAFAEQMLRAIKEHLADADYGVDQLAADVCMSRSALYAKLRTMLGVTPSDFIRNVRLKHAAQLLAETQIPISEIAARIGYNTHKAFSANFKKMFGILPSEYRQGKANGA